MRIPTLKDQVAEPAESVRLQPSDDFGEPLPGAPVLTGAAGTVRIVSDGLADSPLGSRHLWTDASGNRVVIEVAPDEFLFNCHLQPGSIAVSPQQRVTAGEPKLTVL